MVLWCYDIMVLWYYYVIQLYSEKLADIGSCKYFKFINNSREIKTTYQRLTTESTVLIKTDLNKSAYKNYNLILKRPICSSLAEINFQPSG